MTRTRTVFALALLLAVVAGCASETTCNQACEKLAGCGINLIHLTSLKSYGYPSGCDVDCDVTTECISVCVNQTACDKLRVVELDAPLHRCLVACNSYFAVE